jgi:hypothetical protein
MTRLAARLATEAESLAALEWSGEDLLAGAERAAALARVLAAARIQSEELTAMLDVAARGLRAAIPATVSERFPERAAALDRFL